MGTPHGHYGITYRSSISFSYSVSECLRMIVSFAERINGFEGSATMIISLKILEKVGAPWFASSIIDLILCREQRLCRGTQLIVLPDSIPELRQCIRISGVDGVLRIWLDKNPTLVLAPTEHDSTADSSGCCYQVLLGDGNNLFSCGRVQSFVNV